MAVSVDPPDVARRAVESLGLAFPVLCDERREVITRYGLVHADGGPTGDIPIPAQLLVRRDRTIAWRHVSHSIQDRVDPAVTLEQVDHLN